MLGNEEQDGVLDDLFGAAFDEEVNGTADESGTVSNDGDAPGTVKPKEVKDVAADASNNADTAEIAGGDTKDISSDILALKADIEKTQKMLQDKADADKAAADAAAKQVVQDESSETPTAAEIAAQEKFRTDWPEHAAAMDKQQQQIELLQKTLTDLQTTLKAQLDPIAATVAETEQEKFLKPILEDHPDALDLYNKGILAAWIAKQPLYLKAGYEFALNQGTSADVIEVFNAYKKAEGIPLKNTDQQKDEKEEERKAAERKAAEAKLKKLEVPESVRTSVTSEPDPDDFDSGFEQEMKKYSK